MKRISLFALILLGGSPLCALEITGAIQYCHDPSTIIFENGKYWCFSTAPNLNLRSSPDLVTWAWEDRAFNFAQGVPPYMVYYLLTCESGTRWNLWAPEIIKYQDLYYLYYSRNMCRDSDGTERSVCGLAVGSNISAHDWVDQGSVLWTALNVDYRRSIDPTLLFDTAGNLWLAAGSFGDPSSNGYQYGGIWLYQLDKETGMVKPGTSPVQIARAWIEAPLLYYKNGYYYLFFNQQICCAKTNSKYFIRYGRAASITGPYYDKEGVDLLVPDNGSIFHGREFNANYYSDGSPRPECGSVAREIGPGQTGIFTAQDGLEMYSYHFYDADVDGLDTLAIRTLVWGADGWPRAGWNLANGDYAMVSCMNTDAGAVAGGLYVEAAEGDSDIPQLWSFSGGGNQVWNFTRTAGNQYKITCLATNKALAVVSPDSNPNNIYGPGKPVKLVTYDSSNAAHKWYVVQTNNRGFRLVNSATGMAMEVWQSQNAPGASIKVNDWNPAQVSSQIFWLTPTGIYTLNNQFAGLPAQVSNTMPGTRLTVAVAAGSNYQKWRFLPTFDGYTKIVNAASSLPLDLRDGSADDNAQIRQYTDYNNNAQKWAFETLTDGSWRILNKSTGKALTAVAADSGSYVNQLRWLHTLAQQWTAALQTVSPNTRTWSGLGLSSNWSDAANWDWPAMNGELLVFAGSTRPANMNDFGADRQIAGIRFADGAGAFVLGGSRISLAGDVMNDSPNTQTLDMALQLANGSARMFAAKKGDIVVNGTINGAGGLVKSGSFVLVLNGAASYAGATQVNAGTLRLGAANALPVTTALTIASGAVLDLNGFDVTVGSLDNGGAIIDSSCQGAVLTIVDPASHIVMAGNGAGALEAVANHWLETSCRAPDWCMGGDRTNNGSVGLDDVADLSALWLACD